MNLIDTRLGALALGLGLRGCEAAIRLSGEDGQRRYFDTRAFPWSASLEAGWRAARDELDRVLASPVAIPGFEEISEEQRAITQDRRWRVFVLRVFGTAVSANCDRCPRTAQLLDNIPGLQNAMFSILAPRKRIPPHRGPYAGLLRYHLGLKVPRASQDCILTVGDEERCWEEGRALIFDDSHVHSVDNGTDEERVVLFADFERPLAPPLRAVNRVLIAGLGRTGFARRPLARLGEWQG